MATWGGATSFTLSGPGTWAGSTFTLDPTQTTSSIVVFEKNGSTTSGITFANESGTTVLYGTYPNSDDTSFPNKLKTSTYPTIADFYPVVSTDLVTFTTNTGGGTLGSFQMSSAFIWSTSGGSGGTGGSTFVEPVLVKSITLTVDQLPPGSTVLHSVAPFAYRWSWLKGPDFSYINVTIKDPVNATYDVVWVDGSNTVRGTITESGVDTNGDAYVTSRVPIELPSSNTDFFVEEDDGTGVIDNIDGSVNFRSKVSLNFW